MNSRRLLGRQGANLVPNRMALPASTHCIIALMRLWNGEQPAGGTRRSRCDVCNARLARSRWGRELAHPAGAEHATGRLRCRKIHV